MVPIGGDQQRVLDNWTQHEYTILLAALVNMTLYQTDLCTLYYMYEWEIARKRSQALKC